MESNKSIRPTAKLTNDMESFSGVVPRAGGDLPIESSQTSLAEHKSQYTTSAKRRFLITFALRIKQLYSFSNLDSDFVWSLVVVMVNVNVVFK